MGKAAAKANLDARPSVTLTAPVPSNKKDSAQRQPPAAAVALFLAQQSSAHEGMWVHLASSDHRAAEIARTLVGMAPELEVLVLPPWDCLPFDRASPTSEVMGRRMSVLKRLQESSAARVLVLSPESLLQRIPPIDAISTTFTVQPTETLDRDGLIAFAAATGYGVHDHVAEPGEIALFGEVVDVYPADAESPVRIAIDTDGVIGELRSYDPITQRTDGTIASLQLGPASELVMAPNTAPPREPGAEHRMSAYYGRLRGLFDVIAGATATQDPHFAGRLDEALAQIDDAYDAHRMLHASGAIIPDHSGLYLDADDVAAGLRGWHPHTMDLVDVDDVPSFASARSPGNALCAFVEAERSAGRRVVLAGSARERRALARALERGLHMTPVPAASWLEAESASKDSVASVELDIDRGFVDAANAVTVIAGADVLGAHLATSGGNVHDVLAAEPDLRLGDVVLHEDHGIGVLRELETVEIDGVVHDTLRLEYHDTASVLAPVEEIGRIWRYGAEEEVVNLDRLNGDGWPKRRADIHRYLDTTAKHLVALAEQRALATCDPIVPPHAPFARFAARFGYPVTPDQGAAITAVLNDLASGHPMDRLICGDVGFGKTEVALRAAAAVALSGRQVAVCAPTTVLAKQHFQTFERRFAGTGIKIEQLSRLVGARDARTVRQDIAHGEAVIVVGTHALAGDDIAFADLGLMIVDEEQKFGATVKNRLRDMAKDGHLLSMSATPIPRTLQAAMIGVQDVSVIASPPARRRPIRTFLAPFDAGSVRTALLREKRRGGQSFVVAPRIEDIAPLAQRLQDLAPELSVQIAHGGLPAEQIDSVMVSFAEGEGDVLLATNIIESGLDVPRANTMIIWRPDRFGLSQLHQLRGRVGRGRPQGVAYLLHDPDEPISDATHARLSTLEAFDRLGSGLAISARDLDLRGAGELTGDDQTGHMQMIGAALYHRLLNRAVRAAKGETIEDDVVPSIEMGKRGVIPADYVPDAVARINLYARLSRLGGLDDIDAFEDELHDRFGPLPASLVLLLSQTRLLALAKRAGVRSVSAGPKGIALTLRTGRAADALKAVGTAVPSAELKGDRLVVSAPGDARERLILVESLLKRLDVQ